MKIISDKQIKDLNIPLSKFYEWVSISLENKYKTILPPKISLHPGNEIFYNTMPCILPYKNVEGLKTVNRYPGRNPALKSNILLHDLKTGELKAFMDGDYITAIRTGAVAAHSIRLLAKKDYNIIGMIGLGSTGKAALDVLAAAEKDKKFTVKLYKYKNQAEEFIRYFSKNNNLEFVVCDTYDETVKGSHVIVSCVTVAEKDFCEDRQYDEGCLAVPVHTRGFGNCDLFFDKVYGDDTGHICGFKYFDKFRSYAEVAEVVTGKKPGRENDKERILAYNIGLSIHDIFIAEEIYNMLSI